MRLFVFLGLLLAVVGAWCCCMSYGEIAMRLSRETALVIWDSKNKTEHFVRRAEFEGDAKDFGFIFPSPTQPFRIEVADEEVFGFLESKEDAGPEPAASSKSDSLSEGGVTILEEKYVGDYKVTVLKATDGNAMAAWLQQNGHKLRPSMTPWFDHYAKQGWVFTAFKYQSQKEYTPTRAVSISFKAEQPHYPYKMPSDTWEEGHHRQLDLFVISDSVMRGEHLGGSVWPTTSKWNAKLDSRDMQTVSNYLSTPTSKLDLPSQMVLTRFSNSADATSYSADLTFKPNGNNTKLLGGGGGAVAIIVILLAAAARRRRKAAPK